MGIRTKIFLAFLLSFGLVGWLSLVLLQQRLNAEFAALERADLIDSMGRVLKVMDASVGSLTSQTRDWAEWTDMYEYARHPQKFETWVRENLDGQALDTADISFVDVLDAQGQVVKAVRSPKSGIDVRLPAALRTFLVKAVQGPDAPAKCGLLQVPPQYALTCVGRITRSDRSGEFVGAVLMARMLDAPRVAKWQEQTGFGMRLLESAGMPARLEWWNNVAAEHRLGGRDIGVAVQPQRDLLYAPLVDITGAPAATLEVSVPRELYARTQALQKRVATQAIVSALCIAVLLAAAVHWLLVRRLRVFKAQLQDLASEAAWGRRIRVGGKDELGVLASEVNLMLEMIEDQVKDLTAQSMTDTLTGLPNRRAFDMRLALEFGRARRQAHSLSLLMVDVDFFKRYNDRYGHPAGDAALRTVADVLGTACNRAVDMAARMGGEEFSVLLPNTPMEGAVDIAQRIARLLVARGVAHAASEVAEYLTVSIGIASIHPMDESAHALIERADRALYAAKAQGRNRYECDLPDIVRLKEAA